VCVRVSEKEGEGESESQGERVCVCACVGVCVCVCVRVCSHSTNYDESSVILTAQVILITVEVLL